MITYKCRRGHVFDEGEMVRDTYPEGEGMRYRYLCPDCGTEDFEEAHVCEECGYWFREDELEDRLCEKCRDLIDDEVREFSRRFTGARREYAYNKYDANGKGVFT